MDIHNNQTASNAAIHIGEHEIRETLTVDLWTPDHAPRTASARYIASHHHLITVLKTPCFICGSHDDLESHHRLEWSFANAIDWEKVKADFPTAPWASFHDPSEFIDSPDNMVILCAKHHRLKDRGVHNLPWPIWLVQKYVREGFEMF